MSERDDTKREAPISYRPPQELRAEFERRVSASGLSTSAFLTKSVFGKDPPRQSRRPTVDHEAVAKILAALAQLRDELHALSLNARTGDTSAALMEEAVRSLTEIRAACFKALGRKP